LQGVLVTATKILLVDDDEIMLDMLHNLLEVEGFDVTAAAGVSEALKFIGAERYDMLLSDLHMPGAGDGLTVISAMRHLNPECVSILLTSFPEMDVAARAIVRQADEILLKQTDFAGLIASIKRRIAVGTARALPKIQSIATILERAASRCIEDWFLEVQLNEKLSLIPLTREERCGHLPQMFRDLVARLRADLPIGSKGPLSEAASKHGLARLRQGYSAAMMVEESRILQVSIFHTLQKNLEVIDFSVLLLQVMTIADEVDSQLRQATECYVAESMVDQLAG
jgi:CheY-like chemotaxis protein